MGTEGASTTERLRLEVLSGPDQAAHVVQPDDVARVGRILDCEIRLSHQSVSRQHARLAAHHDDWFITDLGSRHGTFLNGSRLEPQTPAELTANDVIRIGPWTFRVLIGEHGHTTGIRTIDDGQTEGDTVVEPVDDTSLGGMAHQRLSLLIDCAARIHAVNDEAELAEVILQSVLGGTGFGRAALLRPIDADREVEVLACRSANGHPIADFSFSRSLIRTAAGGTVARLGSMSSSNISQSIAELRIQSALCAPISIGDSIVAYLYLDARGQEDHVHGDAAEFCQALARMSSLAISNLRRVDLERRQRLLESQLDAASEAQRMIVPSSSGQVQRVRYALRMRPGMFVAGDLFDVFSVGHHRVAVMIGDVTGEGIGAAILMATTQAHLHASLRHVGDPAVAISAVNRYVCEHSEATRFVSMWVGVIDTETCVLNYVDAGHGHWLMLQDGEPVGVDRNTRGIPLGIDSFAYRSAVLPFDSSRRLVLFSDGLPEQRSLDGDPFGIERVYDTVTGSGSAQEDVDTLFNAVTRHFGTGTLDDDTTVASIEIVE